MLLRKVTIHGFFEDQTPLKRGNVFVGISPLAYQHWDISTIHLEALCAHTALEEVCLPYFPGLAQCIFQALQHNTSVRSLTISVDYKANGIADEFGALLANNRTLNSIEIKACWGCTGENAFVAMMEHVSIASHLKKFGIEYFCDSPDMSTCLAVCKSLQNSTLQYLSIPLFLTQTFLQPFAEALCKNSTLQILIFKNPKSLHRHFTLDESPANIISYQEAEALGEMLMANKSLQVVHLLAEFSDYSPIIRGLAKNSTIEEFRIAESARKGVIKLADYVHARKKIIYLNRFDPFSSFSYSEHSMDCLALVKHKLYGLH